MTDFLQQTVKLHHMHHNNALNANYMCNYTLRSYTFILKFSKSNEKLFNSVSQNRNTDNKSNANFRFGLS